MRFDFKCDCDPSTAFLEASPLPLDLVGSNIFLLMVVQLLVAILVLLQKMSALVRLYPL